MKGEGETSPIDMEEALEIVDGDEELLKEILSDFVDGYPKVLGMIKEAVLGHDADRLNSSAHRLKGMLKNVAATMASNIAFELEAMGRKQDLSGAREVFKSLDEACKKLKGFIHRDKN